MFDPPTRPTFDQLYKKVLAGLTDGHLRPADRISVKDLASALKVSTTPLREILSRLVGRGIVEERRSEGYYLARLDSRDITDLYRFHGLCALLTASDQTREQLRPEHDATAWEIYDMLAEANGNAIVVDVRRYLDDRLRLLRGAEVVAIAGIEDEAIRLVSAIRALNSEELKREIELFHERRCEAAPEIALLISRGVART